jgi:hypothetical protein
MCSGDVTLGDPSSPHVLLHMNILCVPGVQGGLHCRRKQWNDQPLLKHSFLGPSYHSSHKWCVCCAFVLLLSFTSSRRDSTLSFGDSMSTTCSFNFYWWPIHISPWRHRHAKGWNQRSKSNSNFFLQYKEDKCTEAVFIYFHAFMFDILLIFVWHKWGVEGSLRFVHPSNFWTTSLYFTGISNS